MLISIPLISIPLMDFLQANERGRGKRIIEDFVFILLSPHVMSQAICRSSIRDLSGVSKNTEKSNCSPCTQNFFQDFGSEENKLGP